MRVRAFVPMSVSFKELQVICKGTVCSFIRFSVGTFTGTNKTTCLIYKKMLFFKLKKINQLYSRKGKYAIACVCVCVNYTHLFVA